MKQDRFLKELEYLLSDISAEEREEALEYYRCYFEDAGMENEASVIEELGSPEKVAYTIKEGLSGEMRGEYTERGYYTFESKQTPSPKVRPAAGWFPFWLIAVIVVVTAFTAVICVLVAVAAALGLAMAAAFLWAVIMCIFGGAVSDVAFASLAVIGGSLFCFAAGLLLLLAFAAYCKNALPPAVEGLCNGMKAIIRKIPGRKE